MWKWFGVARLERGNRSNKKGGGGEGGYLREECPQGGGEE